MYYVYVLNLVKSSLVCVKIILNKFVSTTSSYVNHVIATRTFVLCDDVCILNYIFLSLVLLF